jgi:hypothetical protein
LILPLTHIYEDREERRGDEMRERKGKERKGKIQIKMILSYY